MGRLKLLLFLLLFLFLYSFWQFYKLQKYFSQKERLNVLIYDSQPIFISFDLKEGINYYSKLPLDYKIKVPGGYGDYRIGSIGKLAFLEKDFDILSRGISFLFSSPVDFYFYSDLSKVFYKSEDVGSGGERRLFLSLKKVLVYKTNASFFERIFVLTKFLAYSSGNFELLRVRPEELEGKVVNLEKFHRRIQGNFYNRKIREENKRIKIYYEKNYSAAKNLASIFEGIGIDVLDFNLSKEKEKKECEVKARSRGVTEKFLSQLFHCKVFYDKGLDKNLIKFYLGENLEKKWR